MTVRISIITFVGTLAFAPHLDKGIMIGVALFPWWCSSTRACAPLWYRCPGLKTIIFDVRKLTG